MGPGRASDQEPRACFQWGVERETSSVCCHGFDQWKSGCCASEWQLNSAPERGQKSWFSHSEARNNGGGSVGSPLSMRSRDLKSSVGCFRVKSLHGRCDAQRRLAMCFDGPAQPSIPQPALSPDQGSSVHATVWVARALRPIVRKRCSRGEQQQKLRPSLETGAPEFAVNSARMPAVTT